MWETLLAGTSRLGIKLSYGKSTNLYCTKWCACPYRNSFISCQGMIISPSFPSIHKKQRTATNESDGRERCCNLISERSDIHCGCGSTPHCYCWGRVARDCYPTTWSTVYDMMCNHVPWPGRWWRGMTMLACLNFFFFISSKILFYILIYIKFLHALYKYMHSSMPCNAWW